MFKPFNWNLWWWDNLIIINKILNNINFLEDIKWNKAIKIIWNNNNYFVIKRHWNKYKLETSFSDIDVSIDYNAIEVKKIIKNKVEIWKFSNFKKVNLDIKNNSDNNDDLRLDLDDYELNTYDFDENYYSSLTDCVKFDNEEIEKYKLYSFNPWYDDDVNWILIEYLNNLKNIFENPNNEEILLSDKVYISKYAFEKYEKDIKAKKEILSHLIKYFDIVLEAILRNNEIEFRNKTKAPVNIIIPNDSWIWIYNIKLANFFEVYSSILKMWIVDKNFNITIPDNTILVFSVYDFFRVIYTKNIVTNKLLLIIRKPTVRILDKGEIDFICYENKNLYICDSKLRVKYMKLWEKEWNIIDEYKNIYEKFDYYKELLFRDFDYNYLYNLFNKNIEYYKNNSENKYAELKEFALLINSSDLSKELEFRKQLNKIISQINEKKLFWWYKLEIGNLQNKKWNNNKFIITSNIEEQKIEIEDVFNWFKKLDYSFNWNIK